VIVVLREDSQHPLAAPRHWLRFLPLAGDEAGYITGQVVTVDDGLSLGSGTP